MPEKINRSSSDRALLTHLAASIIFMFALAFFLGSLSESDRRIIPVAQGALRYFEGRELGRIQKFEYQDGTGRDGQALIKKAFAKSEAFFTGYVQSHSALIDQVYALFLALIPVATLYCGIYYRLLRWRDQRHRRYLLWYLTLCIVAGGLFVYVAVRTAS